MVPGLRMPDMLNENGDELLEANRLFNLIKEELCCVQVIVPKVFAHVGDWKVLVCAESPHCVGNFAVKYPLDGKAKIGAKLNVYVAKLDIVRVSGTPVHVIRGAYTLMNLSA